MQIKKDEVKNSIMESAKAEFLEKGFSSSSVRTIVKNAGTTIGNFYNYFSSKEDIFSTIVDETYEKILRFFKYHDAQDEDPYSLEKLDAHSARQFISTALGLFSDSFIQDLVLLTDCAEGTKYEGTKQKVSDYIGTHFYEHRDIINPEYDDEKIGVLLSTQFVEGTMRILKGNSSREEKTELLSEYLLFFVYGMLNILKK